MKSTKSPKKSSKKGSATTEYTGITPPTKNMRTIWKGTISFGLVSVPVSVYPAIRESKFSFNQFRRSDLSPIRYKKVAEKDGVEVPADEIVKGYKLPDGSAIMLTEQDMASINLPSLKIIDIQTFVDAAEIDPRMRETSYFLEAINGGHRGYSIVFEALLATGKVGVAKIALRNREYLAVIRPDVVQRLLVLDVLHFADELVNPATLTPADSASFTDQELKFATMLVDQSTEKFDITKYRNGYNDALGTMLTAKIEGKLTVAASSAEINKSPVPDILEVLRQSVAAKSAAKKAA